MSYNGSGTFQINTSGQPVVTGTVISSSAFNALTADLANGLSTAITKDGQTATTVRIPFAQGINSSLATDTTSGSTGSIFTAGGVGIAKALYVGTNATVVGTLGVTGAATFSATPIFSALTASSAVATDASKNLVSVTNTGTGNNVLATSPTITTPTIDTITSAAATALTLKSAGTTAITVDTSQNVTFAKGLTVGATASPSFSAYANANQTLTSNVATKVILQLEEWDTASAFDSTTNYRFTPAVAGYYKFDAMLRWGCTGAASGVWLALYKNGSLYKRSFELGSLNSMQNGQILLSEMCSLNGSTDYVELYALVAGTSPSLDGTSGQPFAPRFTGFLARSA